MPRSKPDAAVAWLAEFHPDELADFPTEDSGRSHHDVALVDDVYFPVEFPDRPGIHREPQWRRTEALESQWNEVRQRELQRAAEAKAAAAEAPCEHCHLERRRREGSVLGEACYRYQVRTGALPGEAVIRRRARRIDLATASGDIGLQIEDHAG